MKDNRWLYWKTLLVVSLGLFTDGYFLYMASSTEPMIKSIFALTSLQTGMLQAVAPVGAVFGAIIGSPLTDRYGRKPMLLIDVLIFIVVSLVLFFASHYLMVLGGRFLIGVGVGIGYPIYAAYLTENTKKIYHAKIVAIAMFVNVVALPFAAWVAYMLYQVFDLAAWRWIFLSGIIPAFLCLLTRHKLPESKKWLKLSVAKRNESFFQRYSHLFQPKYLHTTIILCLCWFIMNVSYYGIGLFTTSILMSLKETSGQVFGIEALINTVIVNLFAVVGAFIAILMVGKTKKNLKLQRYGFYFSGIALLALSYTPLTQYFAYVIFCFALFNIALNIGPDVTTYLLPAEAYPPEFRATGQGFSAGIAKLGAFTGTLFFPLLINLISISGVLIILGVSLIFAGYLTTLLRKSQFEVNKYSEEELNYEA